MRTGQKHIIDKVFLEVNTSRMETAQHIKDSIGPFIEQHLFPQVEKLFDACREKIIFRFDKVETSVTVKSGGDMQQLKALLLKGISEAPGISEILEHRKAANSIEDSNFVHIQEDQKIVSNEENIRDVFLFYLSTGNLPWYGKDEEMNTFRDVAVFQDALKDELFFQKLKELLTNNKFAFKRLTFQYSPEHTQEFIKKVSPGFFKDEEKISKVLRNSDIELLNSVYYLFFAVLSTFDAKTVEQAAMHTLMLVNKEFLPETQLPNAEWLQLFPGKLENFITHENAAALNKIFQNVLNKSKLSNNQEFFRKGDIRQDSLILKEIVEDEIQENTVAVGEIPGDIVQNAGLVILHPFLPAWFKKSGIAGADGKWMTNSSELAVQALHYLATGEEEFFDWNMIFEKYVCNYPRKMPVRKQSMLTELIREESEKLLKEVIGYWPALKNTSPGGLRQMFLQRQGKMFQNEKQSKLIMERKAQDVLLDKLNWNVSVIKLPWKKDLLFVEW
jgi:hypothetical protein